MFSDISAPVAVGGSAVQATLIKKVVNVQEIQVDYAFIGPTSSLPQAISMKISYSGALKTTGKISLNSARSQVVGNIAGNAYLWGKLGYGTYSFY